MKKDQGLCVCGRDCVKFSSSRGDVGTDKLMLMSLMMGTMMMMVRMRMFMWKPGSLMKLPLPACQGNSGDGGKVP